MTFHGKPRAAADVMQHVHESPPVMLVPLLHPRRRRAVRRRRLPRRLHRRGLRASSGRARSFTLPEQPHPGRDPRRAALGEAGAVRGDARSASASPTSSTSARRSTPRRLAAQPSTGSTSSCSTSGTSTSSTTSCSSARPCWLGRFLWKKGDGWLIDGFGPDGVSARVLDVTQPRRPAADRLPLPLRLRHADRRRRAGHLDDVRG